MPLAKLFPRVLVLAIFFSQPTVFLFPLGAPTPGAVAAGAVSSATTSFDTRLRTFSQAAGAPNSIGYIGCSNTKMSVEGYQSLPATRHVFWSPPYDTGGGSIDKWLNSSSTYWQSFDQQTAKFGQPTAVWVQLCEAYPTALESFSAVQTILANLKQHAPDAIAFISAINIYDPYTGLCGSMGPQGQGETDTVNWRDQAVASGLALRGPDMGPLNATIVDPTNHCHPNTQGEALLGGQLRGFFDTAIGTAVPTSTPLPTSTLDPTPVPTETVAVPMATSTPTAPATALSTGTSTVTETAVPTATNTEVDTATPTGTSTPSVTASPTPTGTATIAASPTPAIPSVTIAGVRIVDGVPGHTVMTTRLKLRERADFLVMYRTRNAPRIQPAAVLKLTRNGKVIAHYQLQPFRFAGYRAFHRVLTFTHPTMTGRLIAHFELTVGPSHATRNRRFLLQTKG